MSDGIFKIAYDRVENLLAAISERQFKGAPHPRDGVYVDDPDLASMLREIARVREVSEADAIAAQRQIDAKRQLEFEELLRREKACFEKADAAMLFRVENLARRHIDVIAATADCARFFARRVGHVQAEKNATVRRYKQEYIEGLRRQSPSVWRALRAGVPGVVSKIGNHAIVRGKGETVYSPLGVVD